MTYWLLWNVLFTFVIAPFAWFYSIKPKRLDDHYVAFMFFIMLSITVTFNFGMVLKFIFNALTGKL